LRGHRRRHRRRSPSRQSIQQTCHWRPATFPLHSPVYGVVFLFKYIGSGSTSSNPQDGTYDPTAVDDNNLFFAAQTIQYACGTQAILSIILNNDPSNSSLPPSTSIDIGPELRSFKDFTTGFPSDLLGEALSNSSLIRETHNSFARSSPFADETQRDASAGTEDVFHFIGYTVRNNTLYELDGLQPHPIAHGPCTRDEFPDKIIPVLHARINRYPAEEVRFNLMAVCRDLRLRAAKIGDQEALARERRKRSRWEWENALRRHNFVGFIGEVFKGVVGQKLEKSEFEAWVEEAKRATEKRTEERKAKQKEDAAEQGTNG
jgi:ubiquitin carboxyl-terminal hydrolase L5